MQLWNSTYVIVCLWVGGVGWLRVGVRGQCDGEQGGEKNDLQQADSWRHIIITKIYYVKELKL